MAKLMVSPTRQYVVMCNKSNFDGFYFRTFFLPPGWRNNCDTASWFFLNRLDSYACVEHVMTVEDCRDIKFVATPEHVSREPIPVEFAEGGDKVVTGPPPACDSHFCSRPVLGKCTGVGCTCRCHRG